MSSPNAEKGARYLAQLDASLCAASWPDIPENARKVEKHAPERTCLTLAARAEAQIASASHRPTSASSSATSSIHSLGDLVPTLRDTIEREQRHAEDAYAARVCLAEIHWLRGDEDEALAALQTRGAVGSATGHVTAQGWQEVCEVKAEFIRASVLEMRGHQDDARKLYLNTAGHVPGSRTAELRRWTERLLARGCMYMWRRAASTSPSSLSEALTMFRAWSEFWHRAPPPRAATTTSHLDVPRREVWRAYYRLLSTILQRGFVYMPSSGSTSNLLTANSRDLSTEQYGSAKLRQKLAFKEVEETYESLLLYETHFPKASQTNMEVEEWVESVIGNWKILSSPQWDDMEQDVDNLSTLGPGVLDILYRASTKTFHSTAILRQLFTVHASLGEFDLAMHAFDSYVEIVSKGKVRAEKTGKYEMGFDSDDMAVLTAADAVTVLCRYGDREQAEKANEVVKTLRKWLGQKRPGSSATVNTMNGDGVAQLTQGALQPKTLAAAHRAIGMCRILWARLTYDGDLRERLRADGIRYLRQAQAQDLASLETALALALALVENRDIANAISTIKNAIESSEADGDDEDGEASDDQPERRLVPLWHLLALCLTANVEHEQAGKMCGAAVEQFGGFATLFGERGFRTSLDSAHAPRPARGIVDQMDAVEKENLVQVKMTQLTLLELMEGPDAAVKVSEELLALYTRAFGSPGQAKAFAKPPPTAASTTATKGGGTLRSIAGSIRPRSRSARRSAEQQIFRPPASIAEETPGPAANTWHGGAPIAITITNEDGFAAEKHHRHLPFKLRGHHAHNGSLRSSKSQEKLDEKALPATAEKTTNYQYADRASPVRPAVPQTHAQDNPASPEQSLGEIPHDSASNARPPPSGRTDQPLRQDVRLSAPDPASWSVPRVHFSPLQDRQHSLSLLVEVWLFIAGLYIRADLFDDCAGAVDAACGLVERLEEEVTRVEGSSARSFFEKGWGLGKSVDELWGDVWAAKGLLSTALNAPFAALLHYENCLSYWPDHADGIIGLSNLLMDIYEQKMPAEEPEPSLWSHLTSSTSAVGSTLNTSVPPRPDASTAEQVVGQRPRPSDLSNKSPSDPSPVHLNRLACRDRAYTLLSTLTKLGPGFGGDNPEAWLALARSHELSGQVGRAKKALWWVLKLEEGRGTREWNKVRA